MGIQSQDFKSPAFGLEEVHDSSDETPVHIAEERGYRRGVQHGAQMTLKAVQEDASIPALYAWINVDLYRWRVRAPIDRPVPPPRPPMPAKVRRAA